MRLTSRCTRIAASAAVARVSRIGLHAETCHTAKLVVFEDSDDSTGPSDRNGRTAVEEMCADRLAAYAFDTSISCKTGSSEALSLTADKHHHDRPHHHHPHRWRRADRRDVEEIWIAGECVAVLECQLHHLRQQVAALWCAIPEPRHVEELCAGQSGWGGNVWSGHRGQIRMESVSHREC